MKSLKIVCIAFSLYLGSGCQLIKLENSTSDYLQGAWISNKDKTLTSFEAALAEIPSKEVSEEAKNLFGRKDFFGRLVVEYRNNTFRSYFVDDHGGYDGFDEEMRFKKFTVLVETKDFIDTSSYDDFISDSDVRSRNYKSGHDCYYHVIEATLRSSSDEITPFMSIFVVYHQKSLRD